MNDNEKQAIEEMAKLQDNLIKRSCTEFNLRTSLLLTEAANAIGTLLVSCRNQEWISVEEQLPKLDTMVLVFTMRGSFEVARYNIYHNGTLPLWMTNEGIWKNEIITHWMPLPEPPKMKGGAE